MKKRKIETFIILKELCKF